MGTEACSFLPPSLCWHQERPWAFRPQAPLGAGVMLPPIVPLPWPMASATAVQLPLFIVSVKSCLLVLSAATLRLKPAKPANSPRRTKCSATLNSLSFRHPAPALTSSLTLFLKGGSRNCSKIGQLFIGLGELWGHHKPPVSWWWRDFEQPSLCLQLFFLPPGNCLVKGATVIEKVEPPSSLSPTPFCRSFP